MDAEREAAYLLMRYSPSRHTAMPATLVKVICSLYDTLYVGFPIWYGCAPNVVNTFLKGYDLSGKKIYAFATSGGSGIGKTAEKLKPYTSGAEIVEAMLLHSVDEAKAWVK
ncbi:MAG: hypothetical protein E7425_12200 [Ruminococcaceae bacterium]|nr:hypothetical protein [Oscillospiraceae bacterium]